MMHELHKRINDSGFNLYLYLTMITGFITQIYIVCKVLGKVF